jgi:hypothetical protein
VRQEAVAGFTGFRLTAPGPAVLRVLTLLGADDLLIAAPTPEAARACC